MLQTIDLRSILFEDRATVERQMLSALDRIGNPVMMDAARHILNAGGKRIRPSLVMTAFKAVGGRDLETAYRVAGAVEIIHNWSLVHDDIIDNSDTRRGAPTVHVRWDRDIALLAGDALNNLAFEMVCSAGLEPQTACRVIRILAETAMVIIDGQMLDVQFESDPDIGEEDYFRMIGKKTGALFSTCTQLGALMGTDDQEYQKGLYNYGVQVGRAFQVQDDLLDLMAEMKEFGKEIGKDIKEGKKTLMVIHALDNAPAVQAEQLRHILDKPSNTRSELDTALEIMHGAGSIHYGRKVVRNCVNKAVDELDVLPATVHRDVLAELATFIMRRSN